MRDMLKLKNICWLLVSLCAVSVSSCDFGDTNVDPASLADANPRLILPAAEAQSAYNVGALGGRMPGIVMQYFAGNDAQQLAYTSYNIGEQDLNNLWTDGLYGGVMKDCAVIIEKAEAQNNPYYAGIARVLMAHALGMATTFWGDVPYSQAFSPDQNGKPAFDAQQDVYASIQTLLDEAITDLSVPAYTNPVPPAEDDLIFGGDVQKWIATARSLKARYYIHLTKKGVENAANALTAIRAGAIAEIAQEPRFPFGENQTNANPYYLFAIQRPNTMGIATAFDTLLAIRSDPRRPFFVEKGSFYGAGTAFTQPSSPLSLIYYEEVKFIEAEALVRTGGNIADAEAAMQAAIRANMEKAGVAASSIAPYLAARGSLSTLTGSEAQIQRIIEEKYVAMYAQATYEAWTDYRRTGYPSITPIPNGTASGLNPGGQIPRRFIYPNSERQTNQANTEEAKSRQGGDLLNVNLWAFQ